MLNVLNPNEMREIFLEIESSENRQRKLKAYKELDIYNQNQEKYINEKITKIYGPDACNSIQTITSINLATRIVSAEASIYKKEPERTFSEASDVDMDHLNKLYDEIFSNEKLKVANRLFKLGSQCSIMVVPEMVSGGLRARVLYKHQYDVVPMDHDPDQAFAYIVPLSASPNQASDRSTLSNRSDNINQKISDVNDKDLSNYKYIVWTDKYNFMCNGNGEVLNPDSVLPWFGYTEEDVLNPIGRLPFIDVSTEKLFGYWVDHGSSLTDFTITFGCILSDMGEIVKLQGYSQPVISSIEEPRTINVGPHRVLWLKKDKNLEGDMNPTFEFATPTPDIDGSLNFIENVLRMFLTSRGTDSKLVSSKEQKDYSSGFERLLAMIDRSEATQEDKVLFSRVEQEMFVLIRLWNNYMQENQKESLRKDLRGPSISEKVNISVKFPDPVQVQTQAEREESAIRRIDSGLMSRLMGLMELYGIDRSAAEEKLAEIEGELQQFGSVRMKSQTPTPQLDEK